LLDVNESLKISNTKLPHPARAPTYILISKRCRSDLQVAMAASYQNRDLKVAPTKNIFSLRSLRLCV